MAKLIRVWDGSAWQIVGSASTIGATGPTGPTGPAGSTGSDAVYDSDQAVISMQVFS